jgi:hypothetical protein
MADILKLWLGSSSSGVNGQGLASLAALTLRC